MDSRLMEALLTELRGHGTRSGMLVGAPGFYRRFGFVADARLTALGVPPEYCLRLRLRPGDETRAAKFHAAFAL